ncbi:MAG: permease-like cell division protein FtsX [Clostridia bacterium]|nr:permease-like cell division protein FtsX [Clostridia bacterium]
MAMIFRNLKYFVTQGVKGLLANSLMTLASIGIVIASLVIFGIFVLFGLNINSIGNQIKDQCEINVYMPNDMSRDNVRAIGSQLSEINYVKEAQLYTKEERLQNYKEGIHQDQAEVITTLEEDNPLRDAYVLSLTDVRKANEVAAAAAKIKGVEEVTNRQDLIKTILSITNTIKHVSIWLLLILAAISIFIISNTIKLGMFSRRKEINIMKFVGATNWFIRWPFIIEGMLLGAVGAAISSVIVMFGYSSILGTLQEFMGNIRILEAGDVSNIIIIGFTLMGIGIGMAGSAMSIRKHLHV